MNDTSTPNASDGHADMTFQVRLGTEIRCRRIRLGLSQEHLAYRSGMSRNFVSLLERGEHDVQTGRLRQLAAALDTTLLALLTFTDEPEQAAR